MAEGDLRDLPLEARARLTAGGSMWATAALPEAGIAPVAMADGPMGIASGRVDERDVSMLTPCGVSLGASFDCDLVRRVGALVAEEARRRGVRVVLAPNLNLPRSPLAGRHFELFSEDPILTGALGQAWIEGMQGRGVAASPKHLAGNDSETDRNSMNAVIDPVALREVYLRPFEMAAEAGAWAMLAAYNRLNGPYCAEHEALLTGIVKGKWGFDGVLMSDWFGVLDGLASARAGLDLEMPGPARHMGAHLNPAVEAGDLAGSRIDDAATRVARLAERIAAAPEPQPLEPEEPLLTEAAAAGFVLLKNEGDLLPLSPEGERTLAIIGPNAAAPCYQGGTFAKIAVRPDAATPLQALSARFAERRPTFEPGVDPAPRLPSMPVRPLRDLGDGRRGMTVELFDGHDLTAAPLHNETRDTNSLTWFAMPGGASPNAVGAVRASGVFTPETSGEHVFYVGATGPVRLRVGGTEVLRSDRQPPAADLMGVLKAGDAESVAVPLVAGRPVEVVAELRYAPFRAQGLWYGVRAPDDAASMLARAEALARASDEVVLIVGETADSGVESRDRTTTRLDPGQVELIERVCAANPNTAVIVNAAHAVDLGWADCARAVMMSWYPGEMFGEALAAVLAGDREPGGRLPITFAEREEDYPAFDLTPQPNGDLIYREGRLIGYRSFQARGSAPRHAFGDGFGYTRFDLEALEAPSVDGEGLELAVRVRNTGSRAGKAVLQAYVCDPREPSVWVLGGFAAPRLAAGETAVAPVRLSAHVFRQWDARTERWTTPAGPWRVRVALSSTAPGLEQMVDLASE